MLNENEDILKTTTRARTHIKMYKVKGGVNTLTPMYMTYGIKHKGVGDGFDHFRGIEGNRGDTMNLFQNLPNNILYKIDLQTKKLPRPKHVLRGVYTPSNSGVF